MRQQMLRLWKDDGGALIAAEWAIVSTILVLGVITGLVAVRNAVNSELVEFANALMSMDHGFSYPSEDLFCDNGVLKATTGGGFATGDTNHRFFLFRNTPTPNFIDQNPCQ
jgi:Flp pilus assembly pilin Flp